MTKYFATKNIAICTLMTKYFATKIIAIGSLMTKYFATKNIAIGSLMTKYFASSAMSFCSEIWSSAELNRTFGLKQLTNDQILS